LQFFESVGFGRFRMMAPKDVSLQIPLDATGKTVLPNPITTSGCIGMVDTWRLSLEGLT